MIKVDIKSDVARMLKDYPITARRAAEVALDHTAFQIRDDIYAEMKKVFEAPTPFTLNSLKVTKTRNHNMQASVWFRDPDRMQDHYLLPEVEGTERKLKGFERALDNQMFIPGRGAKLNNYGNISAGQIRKILSVLGRAELTQGYQANITSKSKSRNTKQRDYFYLSSRHGLLIPGVYERVAKGGVGLRARGTLADKSKRYQSGQRRGQFYSVIRARGVKPILIIGHQHFKYRARLDFYGIAHHTFDAQFMHHFFSEFQRIAR